MAVQRVTVLKAEIEDAPGALSGLLPEIAGMSVNLLNLAAFSAGGGKGAVFCIPDKPGEVKSFARANGISIDEFAGFLLSGQDEIGAGARIAARIADAGINMVLATATVVEGNYHLLIAVAEEDADATAVALESWKPEDRN
ncbi:MAG: hypothetical protein JXA49_08035 [Actinobacteria bacterium]|nr:hypothetical protein [Actinomycetota bacterium]